MHVLAVVASEGVSVVAGVPLTEVSPWALVAMFVVLIATGRLVPRRTYSDKAHEADEWRAESRIKDTQITVKDEQIAVKDKQLDHLAEVGRTVDAIMRAIQPAGDHEVHP